MPASCWRRRPEGAAAVATGSSATPRCSPAVTILALLAGVAIFLVSEGFPALTASSSELPGHESFLSYVAPLAFGTAWPASWR